MHTPSVSVVVNTCDRADPLRTLLCALNRQSYQNFEVVVVVGPTRDHSVKVVSEFGPRVTLLRCPEFNLSMSRNLGIGAARGELVAFIDDDAIPSLTWLEQLADAFIDPSVSGAGGRVFMVHPGHGHLQFRYGVFSLLGEDVDVRGSLTEPLPFTTPPQYWYPRLMGTNMAYRRAALLDVGGYDERFAYLFEEPDLAIRMGLKGYQITPLAEATVYHAPASSRNRENFSWNINWYAWMRGIIYFTLKNAGPVIGRSAALRQAIQHTQTFFSNIRDYRNTGQLPAELYSGIRRQLIQGTRWGFAVGLFGQRQIGKHLQPIQRAFRPFLVSTSKRYPHIGPLPALTTKKVKPMSDLPLRVCLLSSHYPPADTSGVARLTHMLAQGLSDQGHEVHVIKTGQVDRVTYYDGAYVHQIHAQKRRYQNFNRPGYYSLAWNLNYSHAIHTKIEALRREHNIQLVDSPLWLLEGLVTAVSGEVPVVTRLVTSMQQLIELNGGVPHSPEMALIAALEKEFLARSQGLIPISEAIKQTCAQIYPFDFSSRPHQVIHAGIIPLPETKLQLPDGRPKTEPLVLFVGRLEKRKGIMDLFEAIPLVLKEFPQATFWIAGSDNSDNDGFAQTHRLTYPQYFQKKYHASADRVRFLGYIPDHKLDDLYRVCDLFVAPSLYESFGLIFLEAMNHARPVVGCRVGGPAEIVANGETGLLEPPESPAELAAAIIKLLGEPNTRRQMGLAGRQRLLNHFTYIQMAKQYTRFYRELLD